MSAQTAALSSTPHVLGPKPLWGHKGLKLPDYIENLAAGLIKDGHSEPEAIAIAVGAVKRWAVSGGKVSPEVRAAAAKALGEWEKVRAQASAGHGTSSGSRNDRIRAALVGKR